MLSAGIQVLLRDTNPVIRTGLVLGNVPPVIKTQKSNNVLMLE